MFNDKLNSNEIKLLTKILVEEDFDEYVDNYQSDSKGEIHLLGQICNDSKGEKSELSYSQFLRVRYCSDCLNFQTIAYFSVPSSALISLFKIVLLYQSYFKSLNHSSLTYSDLVDIIEVKSTYKLYVEFNNSSYLNMVNFYSLYNQYLKLEDELELLISNKLSKFESLVKDEVINEFFRYYQPSLWNFTTKNSIPTYFGSSKDAYNLAQELYYQWGDLKFDVNGERVVDTFTQLKLSSSKISALKLKGHEVEVNAWLKSLIHTWIRDYLTLKSNQELIKFAVYYPIDDEDNLIVNIALRTFAFYSKGNIQLVEAPKLAYLYIKEHFLSVSSSNPSFYEVHNYHSKEDIIEGSRLWDPEGSGPLKSLESAILSAKAINA
jgi:hypothetical protein